MCVCVSLDNPSGKSNREKRAQSSEEIMAGLYGARILVSTTRVITLLLTIYSTRARYSPRSTIYNTVIAAGGIPDGFISPPVLYESAATAVAVRPIIGKKLKNSVL